MNGVVDWEESVLCTHELFCTHSARTYSTHPYIFRNCYARTYCTRTTSEVSTASIHVISVHTISTHTHVCSRTYCQHTHSRMLTYVLQTHVHSTYVLYGLFSWEALLCLCVPLRSHSPHLLDDFLVVLKSVAFKTNNFHLKQSSPNKQMFF